MRRPRRSTSDLGRTSPRLPRPVRHVPSSAVAERYRRSRARVSATYSSRLVSSRSRACASSSASDWKSAMATAGAPSLEVVIRIGARTPPVPRPMLTTKTIGKLEPFGGVDGHQADRVHGVDGRVRLVTDRQTLEVIGDPRERRVSAILNPADQTAQLLEVLARLQTPGPADLQAVRRLGRARCRGARPASSDRPARSQRRTSVPHLRQHDPVLGRERRPGVSGPSAPRRRSHRRGSERAA